MKNNIKTIKIRFARKKDTSFIAGMHIREIPSGFLSSLGKKFLLFLYEFIVCCKDSYLLVAEYNKDIVGFISGCKDTKRLYLEFCKKFFIPCLFVLTPKICKVAKIKKIFEIKKYMISGSEELPRAEILSMAVAKDFKIRPVGKSTALKLLKAIMAEMAHKDIKNVKTVIGEGLLASHQFFKKHGFQFCCELYVHENEKSVVYTYEVINSR